MPTYFLPLRAGAHKKWGTKTRDFWCCHGTMVQAQCLYPEQIYMADAEAKRLMVCQYIPSSVETVIGDTKISLVQTAGMKYYNDQAFFDENDHSQTSRWAVNFAVTVEEGKQLELALRMPAWLQGEPELWIDEKKTDAKISGKQLLIPVSVSGLLSRRSRKAEVRWKSSREAVCGSAFSATAVPLRYHCIRSPNSRGKSVLPLPYSGKR